MHGLVPNKKKKNWNTHISRTPNTEKQPHTGMGMLVFL